MTRRLMMVVLIASGALCPALARAQYLPSQVGAARMPEPIPCAVQTAPQPDLVPGPITPEQAPPGPPDPLSLPANHSGAFQTENFTPESGMYLYLGSQGFVRQKLGAGAVAVVDKQNLDTGIAPPAGSVVAQRFNDVGEEVNFGFRGTVGYLMGVNEIEFTGFYIAPRASSADTQKPGQLDAFFYNAPIGFEGDNNLFLQADHVNTTLTYQLWNAEINYHYNNPAVLQPELILGARYLDLRENLSMFTDDDGLTAVNNQGLPDPTRQATYQVNTHNRILGPQFGTEWAYSLRSWLALGFNGKVCAGANFEETDIRLDRGDQFNGFASHHSSVYFSQIYEVGAFLDFNLADHARLRAGYTGMWLTGIADTVDQVDFNLANPNGLRNHDGSIFYHGPSIELQLLF